MSQPVPAYSPRVMALFRDLAGGGPLPAGEGQPIAGEAMALERGAWVRFEARIVNGRVVAGGFRAWGCPHLLAATALAAERLRGSAITSPPVCDARALAGELDAPAEKLGRLLLVEDAWSELWAAARALQ